MRSSGVLMHISSLPSRYGIGTFGDEARRFVDFLAASGQKYWQILPLGPTGYGDSPYQSFSTFAGNHYFIDLEYLCSDHLLTKEECESAEWFEKEEEVDYGRIFYGRNQILRKAYQRFRERIPADYYAFCEQQKSWLEDYCLFMAIKEKQEGKSWQKWCPGLRMRKPEIIEEAKDILKEEMNYHAMLQFLFFSQWKALKGYANEKGIRIIGDIPIYVSPDSVDVWSAPEQFCLDEDREMTEVAGCPPDIFSDDGQLWGNPLFDWKYMEEDDFSWWIYRIRHLSEIFDVIRIDHFRGFDSYYAIPAKDKTAKNGVWREGPGMKLFDVVNRNLSDVRIIVEDLGFLTDSVIKLVEDSGYPGMKLMQFAFDDCADAPYQPHNYKCHCVVYTGTHDNNTILGWYESLPERVAKYVREYLRYQDGEKMNWTMMRAAWASVADLSIVPLQDLLDIGEEGRMNMPATASGNWKWRVKKGSCTAALAEKITHYMRLYAR